MRRAGAAVLVLTLVLAVLAPAAGPEGWDPARFAEESTLELRTAPPGGEEHWFPVWLVVLDGDVWVRLGSRAAGRVTENATGNFVGVRIAGRQFDRVRAEPAPPAMVARVADAMAEKYWSDVVIRWFPHPMTLRLVPDGAPTGTASP